VPEIKSIAKKQRNKSWQRVNSPFHFKNLYPATKKKRERAEINPS
jgi:hypothetical protein